MRYLTPRFWLCLLAFASSTLLISAAFQPPASPRVTYDFNPGWKFIREDVPGAEAVAFDDSSWTTVSTPHTWNDVDTYRAFIGHSGGERSPGFYAGIGWYRKHFKLPASAKAGKVFLEFEGLKQAGRFFVNGQLLRERLEKESIRSLVIPIDEDAMIARHTLAVLDMRPAPSAA